MLPADRASRDAGLIARITRRAHAVPDAFALAAYDAFSVAVRTLLKAGATVDGQTLRLAFQNLAAGYNGVTGTIHLDAAGDRASEPYAYWSICRSGRRPRWVRTGGWTPNPVTPTRPGTVTGGTCPR